MSAISLINGRSIKNLFENFVVLIQFIHFLINQMFPDNSHGTSRA